MEKQLKWNETLLLPWAALSFLLFNKERKKDSGEEKSWMEPNPSAQSARQANNNTNQSFFMKMIDGLLAEGLFSLVSLLWVMGGSKPPMLRNKRNEPKEKNSPINFPFSLLMEWNFIFILMKWEWNQIKNEMEWNHRFIAAPSTSFHSVDCRLPFRHTTNEKIF